MSADVLSRPLSGIPFHLMGLVRLGPTVHLKKASSPVSSR